ncbi:hypothetical protein KVR01_000242 [Diaporthe batatas]|uniref:uncharacterized protein n=1 Tax=Diaporthe batatas TaxID=748121 RepID=UPI001D040618|nr:uncharacterized protein KVR01_000242 [Diaporthe batatas]KAG8169497.1 hypothetical protein KVR01_000242 [Diaporthe batatas]
MAEKETPNPMEGLPDPPAVSVKTLAVTGIMVDVYGLDELPSGLTHVSVLWLHNPRLGTKARMAPMAHRAVGEYNATKQPSSTRGLIAAAFDQRNHGTREVHPLANQSWKKDNPYHAQDMVGIISGTVVDTSLLIDALPAYLFLESCPSPPVFDQHVCLGVSLGGHSTWQALFAEPRITAGVSIIGCPDFQLLMKDRARLSKLPTYDRSAAGAGFLGSRDFPPGLVAQCARFDPKGILFGAGEVAEAPDAAEQARLRPILDARVRGKKLLMCTGGDDKLVPWRCSEPFTRFFTGAADGWYKDSGLVADNRVYAGVGHECSPGMVVDAVRFVCDVVKSARTEGPAVSRI